METEKRLLEDHSPSKGAKNAPVTIVEFSDFECPFCRQLAGFIAQAKWSPSDVRVVFKQLPLSMHPWAGKAAISAACVGMQSEESFWRLHDFLFENQDAITSGNIDAKLRQYTSNDAAINAAKLDACTNQEGKTVIEKDGILAEQYQIEATPTVFINGARKAGFRTAEELSTAVEHELQLIKLHGQPSSKVVSAETR
jgi:protein-disulfide isomerase